MKKNKFAKSFLFLFVASLMLVISFFYLWQHCLHIQHTDKIGIEDSNFEEIKLNSNKQKNILYLNSITKNDWAAEYLSKKFDNVVVDCSQLQKLPDLPEKINYTFYNLNQPTENHRELSEQSRSDLDIFMLDWPEVPEGYKWYTYGEMIDTFVDEEKGEYVFFFKEDSALPRLDVLHRNSSIIMPLTDTKLDQLYGTAFRVNRKLGDKKALPASVREVILVADNANSSKYLAKGYDMWEPLPEDEIRKETRKQVKTAAEEEIMERIKQGYISGNSDIEYLGIEHPIFYREEYGKEFPHIFTMKSK